MSKLALPPINTLPPAAQSAFRAISAWANDLDSTVREVKTVQVRSSQQALTTQQARVIADDAASRKATEVVTRRSADLTRAVLENMGNLPPIMMHAPQVFSAQGKDATNTYHLGVGAGGIIGAYTPIGEADAITTFSVSTADGSFYFGAEDPANITDPMHRQILFDATNNVITFGSSIVIRRSSGDLETLETVASRTYTKTNLESDLATGVDRIISGIGDAYFMDVNTAASYIIMGKTGAVYNGNAVAGTVHTALLITANGIAMGYNRASDGAWQNSVALSALGDLTVSGTINATAGNFVESITVNGVTLGTIRAGAAAGASAVQPGTLTTALGDKLNKNAADTLGGTVTFNSSGAFKIGNVVWTPPASADQTGSATGTGLLFNDKGIVGVSGGVIKFVLNAVHGSAIFKGDITGASGTFAGNISTGGTIYADGAGASWGGYSGVVHGNTNGVGTSAVFGNGNSFGYGVTAVGSINALRVLGRMSIDNSSLVTNLKAHYLGWGPHSYQLQGGFETGSATGSFAANKPGANSTNGWLKIAIDGSNFYIPIWS